MPEQNEVNQNTELTDIEVAELANKEIRKRDAEIQQLKRDLAKQKLLSNADEEAEEAMSKEECLKILGDPKTTNYDYARAAVALTDIEVEAGRPNPLGENGEDVRNFLAETVEDCDGDPTRFTAIYQAKIGADDPSIAMAYRKRSVR